MVDQKKLQMLRDLLDPETVAAWLDEVEAWLCPKSSVSSVAA